MASFLPHRQHAHTQSFFSVLQPVNVRLREESKKCCRSTVAARRARLKKKHTIIDKSQALELCHPGYHTPERTQAHPAPPGRNALYHYKTTKSHKKRSTGLQYLYDRAIFEQSTHTKNLFDEKQHQSGVFVHSPVVFEVQPLCRAPEQIGVGRGGGKHRPGGYANPAPAPFPPLAPAFTTNSITVLSSFSPLGTKRLRRQMPGVQVQRVTPLQRFGQSQGLRSSVVVPQGPGSGGKSEAVPRDVFPPERGHLCVQAGSQRCGITQDRRSAGQVFVKLQRELGPFQIKSSLFSEALHDIPREGQRTITFSFLVSSTARLLARLPSRATVLVVFVQFGGTHLLWLSKVSKVTDRREQRGMFYSTAYPRKKKCMLQ